ncbi:hypothetical protein TKK_0009924 [Trichogramma kaykai]
MSVTVSD